MRRVAMAGNAIVLLAALIGLLGGAALTGGRAPETVGQVERSDRGGAPASRGTWPSRTVLAEPARLRIVNQVLDPRSTTDFALTGTAGFTGPFRLRRTQLAGGQVRLGPKFGVSSLGVAAGSLWVFGAQQAGHSAERLRLYQVNPRSLAIVRTWTLGPPRVRFGIVALTPGRTGTVWVSFLRTVLHVSAGSGATLGSIRLPAGLTAGDVALSPSGRFLYVAASDQIGSRSPVIEYSTASGRQLAVNARSVQAVAVGGGDLTAAPGGVWVSFRTGMAGETLLLRQRDLRSVRLPGTGTRHSLFGWSMGADTEYAGTSVFLARADRVAACLGPRTGHVRARGTIAGQREIDGLLGSVRGGRVLYALAPPGVIAVTTPAACRR